MSDSVPHGGPTLERGALTRVNVLALALSGISPTTSVFLLYGTALGQSGTGVIWSFLIAGVVAVCMAACFAELGSMHPGSGGVYTIIRRVLGPVAGGVANVVCLISGLVIPALILVAASTFLNSLVPELPVNLTALCMLLVVLGLSLGRIAPASWVATALLVLELTVVVVFAAFCFFHPAATIGNPILHPLVASGNQIVTVATSAVFLAVGPALFAYNGFDTPLYFDEESRGTSKNSAQAVLVAVGLGVGIELLAVVAATLAVPDLRAVSGSPVPLVAIAEHVMGSTGAKVVTVGVIVAMFAAALAVMLVFSRIVYASARDRMWPSPVNKLFGRLSRQQVPVYSLALMGLGNAVLCAFTSLTSLAAFGGLLIMVLYVLIAISALVSNIRDRDHVRPLKMFLWPLPPLVALVGVVLALRSQAHKDLIITACVVAVSTVGYTAIRKNLPSREATVIARPSPSLEPVDSVVV